MHQPLAANQLDSAGRNDIAGSGARSRPVDWRRRVTAAGARP